MNIKILFILVVSVAGTSLLAETVTDTLVVKGMSCGMCERRIEKNIKKISGVTDIDANSKKEIAIVTFDPSLTTKDAIEKQISAIGYHAGSYPADKTARENLPGCCNPNSKEH